MNVKISINITPVAMGWGQTLPQNRKYYYRLLKYMSDLSWLFKSEADDPKQPPDSNQLLRHEYTWKYISL